MHSNLPNNCKNGGFTLVEVLAAVLILSIAMLAILTADKAARDNQRRAVYISIGRSIAQSKIEELRATPFDSILSMVGSSTDSSLPKTNTITVAISRYPVIGEKDLLKANVTASWPEGKGTRTISYETLIARK